MSVVEQIRIPVWLYVVAGIMYFPFYTFIIYGAYKGQKKLISNGEKTKAEKSIKVASICCWFLILLGVIVAFFVASIIGSI